MPATKKQMLVLKANNEEAHLETITCIRKALIDLLKRRHYSEISMTDIIKKSGISRSGVYKNYKNKAEIIFDIYQEPIDEVIRGICMSLDRQVVESHAGIIAHFANNADCFRPVRPFSAFGTDEALSGDHYAFRVELQYKTIIFMSFIKCIVGTASPLVILVMQHRASSHKDMLRDRRETPAAAPLSHAA